MTAGAWSAAEAIAHRLVGIDVEARRIASNQRSTLAGGRVACRIRCRRIGTGISGVGAQRRAVTFA